MKVLTLRRKMEIIGVNPYVRVIAREAQALKPGWRRPMPVLVQVNGHPKDPWHINMMPMGNGDFYLYLHGDVRKASKTGVGDEVTLRVTFDEDYKGGPADLPDWLQSAIEGSELVTKNWNNLPPSRQKEVVRYLTNLKSKDARKRNINKLMKMLGGDNGHFMGRDWEDGK
jgi:hypothetical protein